MKYFMLSLLAACADLVSKKAVRDNIPRGRKVHIKGRLYLWHIKNKGLAYNKLEDKRKTVVTASASAVITSAVLKPFFPSLHAPSS